MPRPLVHQVQAHAEMGTVPLCNETDAYDIWQILGLNNGTDNEANMPVVDRLQRRALFDVIAGISFTQLPGVLDDDYITVQIRETISRKVIRAYKSYAFE